MITQARCAVCNEQAYRNKHGRMMLHTRTVYDGFKKRAVICEGSDHGARP